MRRFSPRLPSFCFVPSATTSKAIAFLFALPSLVLLAACDPERHSPILSRIGGPSGDERTAVAISSPAAPTLRLTSPDCDACRAEPLPGEAELTHFVDGLRVDPAAGLSEELTDALRRAGAPAFALEGTVDLGALPVMRSDGPGFARRDFSPLRARYAVERLLVVEIRRFGIERARLGRTSLGEPKCVFDGVAYLVELENNRLAWYQAVSIARSAEREWNEPPDYPALDDACRRAAEAGRDAFLRSFSDGGAGGR